MRLEIWHDTIDNNLARRDAGQLARREKFPEKLPAFPLQSKSGRAIIHFWKEEEKTGCFFQVHPTKPRKITQTDNSKGGFSVSKKYAGLCAALLCALALCVTALGTEVIARDRGICDVQVKDAQTAAVTPNVASDGKGAYVGAEALDVTLMGADQQYVLVVLPESVLKDGELPDLSTLSADQILYINQAEAQNGKALFDGTNAAYPKELKTGRYYLCAASDNQDLTIIGSFGYYRMGDVNGDDAISVSDVQDLITSIVTSAEMSKEVQKACDFNGDGAISVSDVQDIITYIVTGNLSNT